MHTHRTYRPRRRASLATSLVIGLIAALVTTPAAADHPIDPDEGPLVEAQTVGGNPTCGDLLEEWDHEFKIDQQLGLGTHTFSDPDSEFEVTITVTDSPGGHVMEFDANTSVDGVFVKGGPEGNLYDYSDVGFPVTSDSNLHAPRRPSGAYAGISHVSFCFDEAPVVVPQDLAASKTAEGSSTRTVTWELEKTVDVDEHSGLAGESAGSSIWTVQATKSESTGGFTVSGTITVDNPNAFDVDVSISDTLDDGTVATVTCPDGDDTGTVPGGGQLTCSYSASPTDDSATANTAIVTSQDPDVQGAQADAPITWSDPTTEGDDTVTLEDERFGYSESISDDTTETFPEEFVCPADETLYTDGTLVLEEVNTATLTGDDTDLSESATVTVTCELPAQEFQGETVTGAGEPWSEVGERRRDRTNTWFEYTVTDGEDGTFDLIQGRKRNVVGEVEITHDNGTAELCFTLESPWTLDPDASGNVKIEPLDDAPDRYLAPGQYSFHFTESGSSFCVEVDSADHGYAIHLDAGYWVS